MRTIVHRFKRRKPRKWLALLLLGHRNKKYRKKIWVTNLEAQGYQVEK